MTFPRASGVLLHPTSLPGPFGIGDFGDQALRFVDFLAGAGQSLWQVLPLGPTGAGASPYSSTSAFAGNTLFISPARLAETGLLTEKDLAAARSGSVSHVDYDAVRQSKSKLLETAFTTFERTKDRTLPAAFDQFCEAQKAWLDDYALFQILKDAHAGAPWTEWPAALRVREPAALEEVSRKHTRELSAQKFYQFLFFEQWRELKRYCAARRIKVIGDMPIFVAHDSVDVWAQPELFKLDRAGRPLVVAGVPPDYFSATGQFWGNPLYNWEEMAGSGFTWWIARLRAMFEMFDVLRIDHFRGFVACWEIPAGDLTAENGGWVPAPGRELFAAVKNALGELPIIAEDLGVITPDVDELRDSLGFPGMRVMQFGFGGDEANLHLPHNYPRDVVAYTATHDNNTTVGWFSDLPYEGVNGEVSVSEGASRERDFCLQYVTSDGAEINWDFISALLASKANTAIVPLQDVLGLGSEARMNLPNTVAGNWEWRYREGDLRDEFRARLEVVTEACERLPGSSDQKD